jgi:DNA-directed RNA polymerase subunit N (RpoN/RPB10)
MKNELETVQDIVKAAQIVFNKYINIRDKGLPCVSCGKPIKGRVNASHFWNANNHHNVRFDEDNVHSSCITCNQFLSGNLLEYRTRLCSKIGQKRFDELEAKRHITKKWTKDELRLLIKKYKEKIKQLEK